MPKNKGKGGKNRRRGKNENESEKRELVFKEHGQEYAQVFTGILITIKNATCIRIMHVPTIYKSKLTFKTCMLRGSHQFCILPRASSKPRGIYLRLLNNSHSCTMSVLTFLSLAGSKVVR